MPVTVATGACGGEGSVAAPVPRMTGSASGIRGSVTSRCHARRHGCMGRPARCLVSTSRRQGSTASTTSRCPTRWCPWIEGVVVQELVRPHRPRSGDPGRRRRRCTASRRSRLGDEGMPLREAIWAGGRRGGRGPPARCPAGGDAARLRPDDPRRCRRELFGCRASWSGAGAGPVLDAGVIDRHVDPDREGRRTLGDLCVHYGIEIGRAHDASADAIASIEVLFALAVRYRRSVGVRPGTAPRRPDGVAPRVDAGLRRVAAVAGDDADRPP